MESRSRIEYLEKFEALFAGIDDLAYLCDDRGNILYVNGVFEKYTGRKISEFIGKSFAPLFEGEDLAKAMDVYAMTLKGESPQYELRFRDTGIICEYKNIPLRDSSGRITGVIGIARDVTGRKEVDERLKDERDRAQDYLEQLEAFFTGTGELVYILDAEGRMLLLNSVFEQYTGFKAADYTGRHFDVLFDEEEVLKAKDAFARAVSGESVVVELRYRDSGVVCEHRSVHIKKNRDGEVTGIIGVARDITKSRFIEERVAEERNRAKQYLDIAGVIFVVIGEDEKVKLINRKGCEVLGYREEEILGRNWFDNFVPMEVRDKTLKCFHDVLSGRNEPMKYVESSVLTKTGSERLIAWHNTVMRDESERVTSTLSSGTDITELKKAQNELAKYRGNLEAIFRSVKDAIVTVDRDLKIIEANDAASMICGIPKDAKGRNLTDFHFDCYWKCVEVVRETLRKKEPKEANLYCEGGCSSTKAVRLTTYPLIGAEGDFTGAVLVIRDETRLHGLEKDLGERKGLHNIIGQSRRMQEMFSLIEDLADVQTTVLITGESGTGKELVAEALHYIGPRTDRPIVKVNCSALSDTLLESELFGHVKGAFTGAVKDRVGRFQLADGGTIFLDEIGDITSEMQLRLLRVLQEREFERVGDSRTMKVDVRIIAATNRNLVEQVKKGRFREDLYYRFKVVELNLPPLRERLEDLPLLTEHFIRKFNRKYGKGITDVSSDVRKIFMDYSWPGNIRELENSIEHAFILCRQNTIGVNHLPPVLRALPESGRLLLRKDRPVDEYNSILKALEKAAWNKSKAARLLGISRRTIYRKMEQYGMEDREYD